MVKKEKLFDMFPPVSTSDWMDKITADLKGADFNKKLVWRTNEGFDLKPFYRSEDLPVTELPRITKAGNDNKWLVRQNITVTDYNKANEEALNLLMNGIDSLGFIISDPASINSVNFRILLDKIHLEAAEINFYSNGKAKETLEILLSILNEKGINYSDFSGAIEADPLGRLMLNGTLCIPTEKGLDYLYELTASSLILPGLKTIHASISKVADCGAGITQELALACSIGNEYLSALTSRGMNAADAAKKIRFSFAAGSNYFFEIAKLRAARLLWKTLLGGYISSNESDIPGMSIHSVTARWNKTLYDPHVNMLRTQTEAMSAILGGTDSLTVEPFDITFRQPDDFSRRIARNQQLILMEEAGFGRVADPAAGSYYIEKLTEQLTSYSWSKFIEYEERGGFLSCLQKGIIQEEIRQSSESKSKEAATRKLILVGTNQYPDLRETSVGFDPGIAFGKKETDPVTELPPLHDFRVAREYEKLRLSVERSGRKPSVFLFTIGNQAMRRARSQFSAVFFGCAGYKIIDKNGFDSVEEGVNAALESKAEIVVICSSDDEYLNYAVEIFMNLKNKCIIVVAGNPACSGELKAAGIENYIHIKSDVPEILRRFNGQLGIEHIV